MYLIDEPPPFASKPEWLEHLRQLREIPDQDAAEVKAAIRLAQEQIRRSEALERARSRC